MLETNYTLNLGQLLKMVPKLKGYLWETMKLDKRRAPKPLNRVICESEVK